MTFKVPGLILGAICGGYLGFTIILNYFESIAGSWESPIMLVAPALSCILGVPIGALICGMLGYFLGNKLEIDGD